MATGRKRSRRTRSNAPSKSAAGAAKGRKSRHVAKVRAYQTNSESAASVTSHSVKEFAARAKNIRVQLCRKRGTLATFEDKLTVLKLYSNFVLDGGSRTHNAACKSVAIGLQMT